MMISLKHPQKKYPPLTFSKSTRSIVGLLLPDRSIWQQRLEWSRPVILAIFRMETTVHLAVTKLPTTPLVINSEFRTSGFVAPLALANSSEALLSPVTTIDVIRILSPAIELHLQAYPLFIAALRSNAMALFTLRTFIIHAEDVIYMLRG